MTTQAEAPEVAALEVETPPAASAVANRALGASLLATLLAACGGGEDEASAVASASASGNAVAPPPASMPATGVQTAPAPPAVPAPGPGAPGPAPIAPAPAPTAPTPADPPAPVPSPSPGPTPAPAPAPSSAPAPTAQQAARFLLQAQFSASDDEIASVRSQGYAAWLSRQMSASSQTGWDWLNSQGYGDAMSPGGYYDQSYPGDYMIWRQLLASPDAVRKRAALALSEFFVVSHTGLDFAWRSHGLAAWWDLLNAHAFGNFRSLLEAVSLNPAMGYWLNTRGNQKENSNGRLPDENYAREVMQLMTIGLVQLNPNGTEKKDAQGQPLDTYTQAEVSALARVFTGYDIDMRQNFNTVVNGRSIPSTEYTRLPMVLNPARHSLLASTFLGVTVAANTPGAEALKSALDALFNHPNVGPFFGKQMIQRLVTSNPSPTYVGRVAAAFNNNGAGVRGDLRAVFRAILLDEEARSSAGLSQTTYGKVREPMVRFVQWARTFGVTSASNGWRLPATTDPSRSLGQSPLRSPSVFNFFRPGYVPPSTALDASKSVAPEFQIINESSVTGYLNFMYDALRFGLLNGDVKASYSRELALVTDAAALVQRLNLLLCAGQLSAPTVTAIVGALDTYAVTAGSSSIDKLDRIAGAVLLVMACPEYLVQK